MKSKINTKLENNSYKRHGAQCRVSDKSRGSEARVLINAGGGRLLVVLQ